MHHCVVIVTTTIILNLYPEVKGPHQPYRWTEFRYDLLNKKVTYTGLEVIFVHPKTLFQLNDELSRRTVFYVIDDWYVSQFSLITSLNTSLHCDTFNSQGLYSLSGRTSYRWISWSLEAARLDVVMIGSLWNRVPVKFQSDWKIKTLISWLRHFTRSYGKTSIRLMNIGPTLIAANWQQKWSCAEPTLT